MALLRGRLGSLNPIAGRGPVGGFVRPWRCRRLRFSHGRDRSRRLGSPSRSGLPRSRTAPQAGQCPHRSSGPDCISAAGAGVFRAVHVSKDVRLGDSRIRTCRAGIRSVRPRASTSSMTGFNGFPCRSAAGWAYSHSSRSPQGQLPSWCSGKPPRALDLEVVSLQARAHAAAAGSTAHPKPAGVYSIPPARSRVLPGNPEPRLSPDVQALTQAMAQTSQALAALASRASQPQAPWIFFLVEAAAERMASSGWVAHLLLSRPSR